MTAQSRPPVWQMVREAMDVLGPETTNAAVREWVLERYPGTNKSTISCQTIVSTVNHASRIHYSENHRPRIAEGRYDFLFRPERGKLERYNPERHGRWEIAQREDGGLFVRQLGEEPEPQAEVADSEGHAFAYENHLRDYLASHLDVIETGLQLYVDEDGHKNGVEYVTPIGRIDLLTVDSAGALVIIELKVARGSDAACGQLLRYMGWAKRHLPSEGPVRGLIIARHASERLRYATADIPHVDVREYSLKLTLHDVPEIGG